MKEKVQKELHRRRRSYLSHTPTLNLTLAVVVVVPLLPLLPAAGKYSNSAACGLRCGQLTSAKHRHHHHQHSSSSNLLLSLFLQQQ